MSDLSALLANDTRPKVVEDLATFVDKVVAEQSGITGMALKGAVRAARTVDSNIVRKGMNRVLPDMLTEIRPHWAAFEESDQDDFGAFLDTDSAAVTDTILGVADKHADTINVTALRKAYNSLRGRASTIIEPHIPELGRILQRHL